MIFQPENNIGESSRPARLIFCGNLSFLLQVAYVTSLDGLCPKPGVRHDPQRFMGKTVAVPHFNGDTVEFTSLKRDESNPRIKTLLPFLKDITEESDLENFQDLIVALDACYWLHKTISRSLSRFGDDRAI